MYALDTLDFRNLPMAFKSLAVCFCVFPQKKGGRKTVVFRTFSSFAIAKTRDHGHIRALTSIAIRPYETHGKTVSYGQIYYVRCKTVCVKPCMQFSNGFGCFFIQPRKVLFEHLLYSPAERCYNIGKLC